MTRIASNDSLHGSRTLPRLLLVLLIAAVSATTVLAGRPNVLFIAVDDLRPELGCYGQSPAITPNIDGLAKLGTVFLRAYCQQAVCNPSRASLMTGMRPDSLKVWDLSTHFRDARPDAITIAQHFKADGYHTERLGKIFHLGHGNRDDKASWSIPVRTTGGSRYGPKENAAYRERLNAAIAKSSKPASEVRRLVRGLPYEAPQVKDDYLTDGAVTQTAIKALNEIKDQPFFLAVGFANPHLPFVAPKRYWDLYDASAIKLADNPYAPKGAPPYAMSTWGELRKYHGMPAKGPLTREQAINMRHGYYAATSYVDALVGRLLGELDRLELREKTIVVLWGDHGWKLGEHGGWCKHTNFELDARAPLIISAPGQSAPDGKTQSLVEFVDVFPTLCDLAKLPKPKLLEGTSLAPLLSDPTASVKDVAVSQYPRGGRMGYSMKTDRYRLTVWRQRRAPYAIDAVELYDHQSDPAENKNVAADNEATVKALLTQMTENGIGPQ